MQAQIQLRLLRRRFARHHCAADPLELKHIREVTAAFIASASILKEHRLQPEASFPEHAGTGVDLQLRRTAGLAGSHDAVQGGESGRDRENASVGLCAYPAPDGADILSIALRTCPSAKTRSNISERRATLRRNSTTTSPIRLRAGFGGAFFPLPEPVIKAPRPA